MSLPTPPLDDRRFQDIVDEAKRLIPRYCPEWTDHNVSDPGIALVELFAWMSEMIIYRLNQVPDIHYTRFLQLLGIGAFPPLPASARIAFWLSTPQQAPIHVPVGTEVGTQRTETQESIVFSTEDDLHIVPPRLNGCVTTTLAGNAINAWDDLRLPGRSVACFSSATVGDAVCFGFPASLAGNILRLTVKTTTAFGIGINPDRPPWAWEAWNGEEWEAIRVYRDSTAGLNTDGEILLILPPKHEQVTLGATRAYWIRCSMMEPEANQPGYQSSPSLDSLTVDSIGGVMLARHALRIPAETLGRSEGMPGQHFRVRRPPVLASLEPVTLSVTSGRETEVWTAVDDFSGSGPDDRHFVLDAASGDVRFGDAVRYADGSLKQHGAVPPLSTEIAVNGYRTGGGAKGNVGTGTLAVLKSSIPFVARVENIEPARGGVDGETIDELKIRGPLTLRTGQRAVTVEDFERIALEASPLVARAKCVSPATPGGPIRVLIVPRLDIPPEDLALDDLTLPPELVDTITPELDRRRILTSTVEISTPSYQGLTVVARVRGGVSLKTELLRDRLLHELYAFINPLVGGPRRRGWPFGREINVGEVFALLAGVEGVVGVEEVRLYTADLRTGERREAGQNVRLLGNALFASYKHQVQVR